MWLGADLLYLGELDRLLGRSWFTSFVYTPEELATAESFGPARAREFLAGRFAAKEAVLKVLGTGMAGGVRPCQVAVLREDDGAPAVRLTGAAAARAATLDLHEISVTITHKRDLVLAVALGLPEAYREAMAGREGGTGEPVNTGHEPRRCQSVD
ncbi:holo-ACP synthase [Streptomyces sp. DT24]|uniref:holo-ACP synthase n=1 Tax=unclassified Streptomyces TaxID=2593676 RepID=UPI0023B97C1E|nr:holo-ACP synthase [Streptomyces sp. AM 4-1-1]WEH34404.1 holo-ACP synthase [Streptomyces sp. AM 4-1-1]